jgi:hypothetical protein
MSQWKKNPAGVKDGAQCYRTIAGIRWEWYGEDPICFKGAGIRYRTSPGGGMFIHPGDHEKAMAFLARAQGQAS